MALIQVTQEHIDKGEVEQSDTCPIALACKDAGIAPAFVGNHTIWPTFSDWLAQDPEQGWALPETAKQFVKQFDAGEPVSPFSFELELPEVVK